MVMRCISRQIVDLALLVKQDTKACASDPMALVHPSVCLNYHDVLSSPALGESKSSAGMTSPTRVLVVHVQ